MARRTAARTAHLEQRRRHGDEDVRLHQGLLRHRPGVHHPESGRGAVAARSPTRRSTATIRVPRAATSIPTATPITGPRSGTEQIRAARSLQGRQPAFSQTVTDGWIAATQNDFVSAVVLPKSAPYRFTSAGFRARIPPRGDGPGADGCRRRDGNDSADALRRPDAARAAREDRRRTCMYVVGYGYLTILAGPLFWLLSKVHALTGNWGVAIIAGDVPAEARCSIRCRRRAAAPWPR